MSGDHVSDVVRWLEDHDPIAVVTLNDPVVDAVGYDVDSDYTETFWLPTVGPTALWLLRRVSRATAIPELLLDVEPLAQELGLGRRGASYATPFVRALARLVMFHLVEFDGDYLAVRRRVPPLSRRQVEHLPEHLQAAHLREMTRTRPRFASPMLAPFRPTLIQGGNGDPVAD